MKRPQSLPRAVCTCVLVLLCSVFTYAQTHYDFAASSGTFTPLAGATPITFDESDDGISGEITIPFSFTYFGSADTKLKVCTNGFINFDETSSNVDYDNDISYSFDPIIAPLWDDLGVGSGSASYLTEGISPNRVFTVQWLNFNWNRMASANISFQIKLYETTNKIEFVYRQEAGALSNASASIGIVGYDVSHFYSLGSTSTSPPLSIGGNNSLSSKPASNQVYSFTPGSAPSAPTVQASPIVISNLESESMTINWTNGDGDYRVVFMKQTATSTDVFSVTDGDTYVGDPNFGDSYAGSGWYTVYNGTGSLVNVTDLQSGKYYQIQVMEYNGLGGNQKYLTTTATNNPVNQPTLLVTPTQPGSEIFLYHVGTSYVNFNVEDGNGTGKAVFIKAGSSGTPPVADNTSYTGDTEFGSGSQIGTSGWYCVFNGSVTPGDIEVTNLAPGTSYRIAVVDYNGETGEEKYLVSDIATNPVQLKTYPAASLNYSFASSSGTFTELTGATPIDEIEWDEVMSESIPIGFSFEVSGQPFTQVKVSSNGFISFNPYATDDAAYANALNSTYHTPLAAPLWDDLDGSTGDASYITTGSVGNRIFTVEFKNWQWNYAASGTTISFQIKLYESNNKIEFIYRQESGAVNNGSATIGIGLINIGDFLSLTSSTTAADTSSVTETFTINTKPASGQIFSLTPIKGDQQITFDPIPARAYGEGSFALSASSTSGLPISFSSSNTNVATISGNMVTIVGTGTISITASQSGNESFNAATGVERSLVVNKGNQVITFPALPGMVFGDAPFGLDASIDSGVELTLVSSNTNVATISGTIVTITGVGTTTITASQAGNANWNAATSIAQDLVVSKGNQTITFDALSNRQYGAGKFLLEGAASSNLSITYTSSDTDVITISGNEVTLVGVGSADITASQAGNANYNAATNVVRSLTVEKGSQVITFEAFGDRKHIGDIIELEATSDSGLPVSYSSSDESVATVEGTMLTVIGGGAANIVASQAGNSLYNEATAVTQEITAYSTQTITFTNPGVKTVGDNAFSLTGSASSGLDVSFTTDDNNVTITGGQVTILGPGTVTIVASQNGNDAFEAATSVEQTFCINPAKPVITLSGEDSESPTLTSSVSAGNQWHKDGAAITGETQTTLAVSSEGTYSVRSTVEGCVGAMSDGQVIVVTDIEDALSGVSVYPNPVQKSFTVDVSALRSAKPVQVSILDVSGREIQTWSGNGKIEFNIATYKSGNYLLNIKAGKKLISKQLTKE